MNIVQQAQKIQQRSGLAFRLMAWFLLLAVIPLAVVLVFFQRSVVDVFIDQMTLDIRRQALTLAIMYGHDHTIDERQDILRTFSDANQQAMIIDTTGRIVEHTDAARAGQQFPVEIDQALLDELQDGAAIRQISSDAENSTALDDQVIYALALMEDSRQIVVLEQPLAGLLTPLSAIENNTLLQIIVSLLVIAILGGAGVWLFVGQPVSQLTQAARSLGNGDLDTRVDLSIMNDELHLLGSTFNSMAGRVKTLVDDLQDNLAELEAVQESLMESEERYRTIFESVPVSLWEYNLSPIHKYIASLRDQGVVDFEAYFRQNPQIGKILFDLIEITAVNQYTVELFNAPDKAAIIEGFRQRIPPQSMLHFIEAVIGMINGSGQHQAETTLLDHYMQERYVLFQAFLPGPEKQSNIGLISIIDLTERQRTEEALRSSEQMFAATFNSSPDCMAITRRRDGVYLQVNPGFERMTGFTLEEVFGKSTDQINLFVDPDERRQVQQDLREFNTVIGREVQFRREDGSQLLALISVVPIYLSGEACFLTIARDITSQKQAEERVQNQLERLSALRNIDITISASHDLRFTLDVLLEHVVEQLKVDAASILLLDRYTHNLEYGGGRGFKTRLMQQAHLRLGESYAGRAALERVLVRVPDLREGDQREFFREIVTHEGFVGYFGAPLIAKGQVKGVLEVYLRQPLYPDSDWLDFYQTLAGQAAIAIDSAELFENLQRANIELTLAYDTTLEGWVRAIDLRNDDPPGYSEKMADWTMHLARHLGVSEAQVMHIRRGALLHDVGELAVPEEILKKPGPLDEDERAILRQHPQRAYELLSTIPFLRQALDIPYSHHERWDGKGYPLKLREEQIPLPARIFSVINVWSALRRKRPYREAWSDEQALDYLRQQAGVEFDPQVVQAFLVLLQENPQEFGLPPQ